MKNALILHGAGNDHSGNWFPWLKNKLESKGYRVWVPDLPNSDKPDNEAWLNTIFSNKDWVFNDESVIIGHSAGATLILRILERISNKVKVHKSILVAGPCNLGNISQYFVYKESLVRDRFEWEKIKNACDKFYLIYSDNDPYDCGIDQGIIIHKNIGGELIIKKDEQHFNLEKSSKYKEFPLLVDLID